MSSIFPHISLESFQHRRIISPKTNRRITFFHHLLSFNSNKCGFTHATEIEFRMLYCCGCSSIFPSLMATWAFHYIFYLRFISSDRNSLLFVEFLWLYPLYGYAKSFPDSVSDFLPSWSVFLSRGDRVRDFMDQHFRQDSTTHQNLFVDANAASIISSVFFASAHTIIGSGIKDHQIR